MKIDAGVFESQEKQSKSKSAFNWDLPSLKRISDKQKEAFYREFSALLKSGIDFNQSLNVLRDQQKSKTMKEILGAIHEDVVKGKSLHEALQGHKQFSAYEFYSVKIGEDTRRLPQILDQLKKYFTRKIKLRRQIVSVLAYPTFVLFITFAVLYFMLKYVVPMFASVFQQFGKELPEITKFVVKLSNNFNIIALSVFGFIAACLITNKLLKRNDRYRAVTSKLIVSLPFFGKLIKKIYIARFCQTFGLLLSAKTPLVSALELTREMIHFYPLRIAIETAKIDVLRGLPLSQSFKKHQFFSQKLISLTQIGEEINELDRMYEELSEQYNEDIEHFTKLIGTILEPAMIVVIGAIVGFIMIAMYSPIFNLSKVIEN